MGNIYDLIGNFAQAAAAYEKAIALDPQYQAGYENLSRFYTRHGDQAKAAAYAPKLRDLPGQ